MSRIGIEEFDRVEMRVGRVLQVEEFPKARKPSYRLLIDFGPYGVRRSSAAVEPFYPREDLVGRQVVAVMNFPPRRIADFESEVLVLGAVEQGGRIILLRPDAEAELGARIA
ncbi:MAG TPA: tRNA-binding protein [bacterium]|jgi:tRNA-binding protein|nr:tRNA-binding protein [bacterium]